MARASAPGDLGGMSDTTPPSSPPSSSPPPAPRRLLRSRDDRVIGGVCSGLAKYFNIDPLIVRIAAVALLFAGGISAVAYLAALLLVPDDDGTGHPVPGKPGRFGTIAGAVIIVGGGVALINGGFGWSSGWLFGAAVPTLIVVAVLAVAGQRLLANRGENQPAAARIAGAALILSGIVLGALVLAVGGAVATAAGGGTAIAIVVVVLGIAMVALSFQDGQARRARWLALPALALAIPAGVVAAAGVDVHHGVGTRNYAPASIADVRPAGYQLGVGQLVVDLRDTQWPKGDTINLKVDVGTGHALVLVPEDVCVQSHARTGLGYVGVLGTDDGGADIDTQRGTVDRSPGMRRLVLNAKMGIGAVEVRHFRDSWDHGHHHLGEDISATLANAGCAGERV
jgi:phage shock protein PspC (stress-responsive transcriptional regulator)/predicted membrane protein